MSKTFKDKKFIYGGPLKTKSHSKEKNLSRKYEHFKRFGPFEIHDSSCAYCGRPTEFEGGYLVCHDCGGVAPAFNDSYDSFLEAVAA